MDHMSQSIESRSITLKASNKFTRALREQSIAASVEYPKDKHFDEGDIHFKNRKSLKTRNDNRHRLFETNDSKLYPYVNKSIEKGDFHDDSILSDEDDDDVDKIDTSWFISKEEILDYLQGKTSSPRGKQSNNPTEVIYQNRKKHRGWTIRKNNITAPDKSPKMSTIPNINTNLIDNILESESEIKMSKPSPSFLFLPKPKLPGPVLTYKQLSDLYDTKSPKESSSPMSPSINRESLYSPPFESSTISKPGTAMNSNQRKKLYVSTPSTPSTPSTHPITPQTPRSLSSRNSPRRHTSYNNIKGEKSNHKTNPSYIKHIETLRSCLNTGRVFPVFLLYFNNCEGEYDSKNKNENPQMLHHLVEDSLNSTDLNEIKELEILSQLREALYMKNIEDENSFKIFQKKSEIGLRVLKQKQLKIEEILILKCLDFLSAGELFLVSEINRNWFNIVYLKLYLSENVSIVPLQPLVWNHYVKSVASGTMSPPSTIQIQQSEVDVTVLTSISPKMISCLFRNFIQNFHILCNNDNIQKNIAVKFTDSSNNQFDKLKQRKKSIVLHDKNKAKRSVNEETVHVKKIPNLHHVYSDLHSRSTKGAFSLLKKLSLVCVVLDRESVSVLSNLSNLESLSVHFVKIRKGGLFGKCSHCFCEKKKLTDMMLCPRCHSITSPYCDINCLKEDHLKHIKTCAVVKNSSIYNTDNIPKYRKFNKSMGLSKYVEEEEEEDLTLKDGSSKTNEENMNHKSSHTNHLVAWLDGHFLRSLFEACGKNLIEVSLIYVLPSSTEDSDEIIDSFEKNSIFPRSNHLKYLKVREVHESLLLETQMNTSSHGMDAINARRRKKWNHVKAFNRYVTIEAVKNCPELLVIDIGGNSENGVTIPVKLSLKCLKEISSCCPNLTHLGYFTIEIINDMVPSMIFMDDKSNWKSLVSCSMLVEVCFLNTLLQILCGNMCFHESKLIMNTNSNSTREKANSFDGNENEDKKETTDYLKQMDIDESSGSDSDSSSESSEDSTNFTKQKMLSYEVILKNFTIKDNRKEIQDLSSEEIGDSITFFRHIIAILNNSIKYNSSEENFDLMKTIIINRRALKAGFISQIGKNCGFLPKNMKNCEFFAIITYLNQNQDNFHVSIDSEFTNFEESHRHFSYDLNLIPCSDFVKLSENDIKQDQYYILDIQLLDKVENILSEKKNINHNNKVVIKFQMNIKDTYISSNLGLSSLLKNVIDLDDREFLKLNLNSEHQSSMVALGSKAEDEIVTSFKPISDRDASLNRVFQLSTSFDGKKLNELENVFANTNDMCFPTNSHDGNAFLSYMKLMSSSKKIMNLIAQRSKRKVGDGLRSETISNLKNNASTSQKQLISHDSEIFESYYMKNKKAPVLIIRFGPFELNFDPKKKAKQRERDSLRLEQHLRKISIK